MNTPTMNYQLLGRSGLRVSDLSLGTMTFGEDWGWGSSKDEARQIYDAYRAAGGNFVDTANVYTNGTSETLVGEFVAGHRAEVVIATKYTSARAEPGANAGGNHRKSMVEAVEGSLKRLGTDYLDLYWLHAWDGLTPAEEVMRAFDDLVRAGKVLYVGISDAPAWVVAQSNTMAELRGWTRYVGLQVEYSLLQRTVERELTPMAKDQRMTVLAWSPLAFGKLTGKYLPENKPAEAADHRLNSAMLKGFDAADAAAERTVREVVAVAAEMGVSPAQVSIAWLLRRPVPVVPILGARKLSQFEDNLRCLSVTFTPEQLARLDKASAVPLGFPHEFLAGDPMQGFVFGQAKGRIRV